jgi:MoxR-like ATPase
MDGARTRPARRAESVAAMVRGHASPHAILLVGPDGVGKTTLALDLAAGPLARPMRRIGHAESAGHAAWSITRDT